MNGDATGYLEGVRAVESPNCDARPAGTQVTLLVVHSISLPPGEFGGEAIERLFTNQLDPHAHPYYRDIAALRVSAHFLLRRGGEPVQFVPLERRAWHAGESRWRGRTRCNDFSVGVELEGDELNDFTAAQYEVFARLVTRLRERLPLRAIAAHSDLAPDRKRDPGPRFDWEHALKHLARRAR